MKRISTQKNSLGKRILINIPFVLFAALATVAFAGGLFLLFYSVVTAIAFSSAMISLVLIGSGALLIGAGLGFVALFKKYFKFYNKQMGWVYVNKKEEAANDDDKTKVYAKQKSAKSWFKVENISICFLLLGAVCTFISAALGCVKRANWVEAIRPYKEAHGYYDDIKPFTLQYPVGSNINVIRLDLANKQAVVKYTDAEDFEQHPEYSAYIVIDAYTRFEGQLTVSLSADGTLTIVETVRKTPDDDVLAKLLFFIGDAIHNLPAERQLIVYIPPSLRDTIEIVGDHTVAKD